MRIFDRIKESIYYGGSGGGGGGTSSWVSGAEGTGKATDLWNTALDEVRGDASYFSNNNPFQYTDGSGELGWSVPFDPTNKIAENQTAYNNFKALIDNNNPISYWQAIANELSNQLSATGIFADTDIDSLVTSVISKAVVSAGSTIDEAIAKGETSKDSLRARLGQDLALPSNTVYLQKQATVSKDNIDDLVDRSVNKMYPKLADEMDRISAFVKPETQNFMLDSSRAVETEHGYMMTHILTQLLTDENLGIGAVITKALNSATEAVSNSFVDAAVESFEDDQMDTYLQSVNRFTGGMAEINAVQSSAFVIGLAMMEKGFTKDVARFRANLSLQIYDRVITSFIQVFGQSLSVQTQSFVSHLDGFLRLYQTILPARLQGFLSMFPEYIRTYLTEANEFYNVSRANANIFADAGRVGSDGYLSTFNNLANTHLRSQISRTISGEQSQSSFASQIGGNIVQMDMQRYDLQRMGMHALSEMNRLGIVAQSEYKNSIWAWLERQGMWSIDIWNNAANVISTGAGGVSTPRRSQVASALGGAMSGAASGALVGSAVPGLGTATGAIVGGVIGGVGGFLS